MRKNNFIIFMAFMTICTFAFLGINKVNAAVFNLQNTDLVCEPASVSSGQSTDCYLIGVPSPTGTEYSANGYVTYAYTTRYLNLNGAAVNSEITNADVTFIKPTSATQAITMSPDMPTGLTGFQCTYDSQNIEGGLQFACAIFYTKKDQSNAFTPTSIKKVNSKISGSSVLPNANFGIIGSYQVSLSNDMPEDVVSACGELCVKAWVVPGSDDYNHVDACATDGVRADGNNCTDISSVQTTGTKLYTCQEVHVTGKSNPDTGTFASYALLVAGALIAISAITLANKNNKIYRV